MLKLNRFGFLLMLLVGIVVIGFITTKATVASFTHDESYTYNAFVHDSFMNILSYKNSYTNNHLLNTLMMKYSEVLFGSSELALRLPNLIMLLVFFVYSMLLLKNTNPLIGIAIVLIIITNAGLIDIFGLARGYGISIAFMTMGLYHLIRAVNSRNPRNHLILFNIAALCAILSNFTMLDFYIAGLATYTFIKWVEYKFILNQPFNFFKINKINFLLFVPMFIVLYEPVRRVITYNQFNFGGSSGFVADTVQALVYAIFSNVYLSEFASTILKLIVLIIVAVPLLLFFVKAIKKDSAFFEHNKSLLVVNIVLVVIFLEIIIQHLLLNTDYLVGRFALFLFPLFIINIGLLLDYAIQYNLRNAFLGFVSVWAVLSTLNFFLKFDFNSCAEWGYDSNTKNAIIELKKSHDAEPDNAQNVKLEVSWLFEPTANFYRKTWGLDWLQPINRDSLSALGDYYYISITDLEALKLNNHKLIYNAVKTNTILIKNNL